MAIRHFRGTPCDYNFPVFSKGGTNVKFIHRELTGVKLALIGCTSAASSICEATRNTLQWLLEFTYWYIKTQINFVCRVRPRVCGRMYLTMNTPKGLKVKFWDDVTLFIQHSVTVWTNDRFPGSAELVSFAGKSYGWITAQKQEEALFSLVPFPG